MKKITGGLPLSRDNSMRLSVFAPVLAALIVGCGGGECGDDALRQSPAMTLLFDEAVEEGACTIWAQVSREDEVSQMRCYALTDSTTCACEGGDLYGTYDVYILSVETGELLDSAVVVIGEVGSPQCRSATLASPFEGYFPNWRTAGAGGAGGAGGADNAGGADIAGGADNAGGQGGSGR